MLTRVLEPEVMDSDQDAREYDAMDHAAVNALFVTELLDAVENWSLKRPVQNGVVPRHREINDFIARRNCRDLGIAEP